MFTDPVQVNGLLLLGAYVSLDKRFTIFFSNRK